MSVCGQCVGSDISQLRVPPACSRLVKESESEGGDRETTRDQPQLQILEVVSQLCSGMSGCFSKNVVFNLCLSAKHETCNQRTRITSARSPSSRPRPSILRSTSGLLLKTCYTTAMATFTTHALSGLPPVRNVCCFSLPSMACSAC